MPKIDNFKGDKQKPDYLNVIEAVEESDFQDDSNEDESKESEPQKEIVFYVYTGVGSQSVVFKRLYTDLAYVHSDEKTQKDQIEEARALLAQGPKKRRQKSKHSAKDGGANQKQSQYDDMLERMDLEHIRDKENIKA